MNIRFLLMGWLLIAPLMVGCGGGESLEPKNRPKRTPVSGTVTLKGTAVEGATVTLHPVDVGNADVGKPTVVVHAAVGKTDAAGKFVLGTFSADDGAVPGSYNISVFKLDTVMPVAQPAPGEPGYDPNPKPPAKPKQLLPEKYADPLKSKLSKDVGTDPITDLDLKLE